MLDKKFTFENKIDVDVENVRNVLSFLKYYLKVKKSCDNKADMYNKKLLKSSKNEELKRAFAEFVRINQGGKYLRAMLVSLGYNCTNKKDNKYLNLALALEVFQTSILIHDDIIDNANMRRGKETIPASYKKNFKDKGSKEFIQKRDELANSIGICIGDLGFYLAEQLIVEGYKKHPNLTKILSYYHEIAIKTCQGEIIDIILPFKEKFYETDKQLEEKIMEVYKLKTSWYSVIGPVCLGLMLGNAPKKQIIDMEKILLNTGIAFQIKDDLLGIYGSKKHLGKSTNSDIEEYKQTILYSYVMTTSYKEEFLKYYGKRELNTSDINKVKQIFEDSGAKTYAENLMNKLLLQSLDKISKIKWMKLEYKNILKGFIVYLKNRTK